MQCVKLRSRLSAYSKQLKAKRTDELSEMDKLRLRKQHDQCDKALQNALLNFDKASPAVAWLQRDFELVYATLIAHSTLHSLMHARDEIKTRLGQLFCRQTEQAFTCSQVSAHSHLYCAVELLLLTAPVVQPSEEMKKQQAVNPHCHVAAAVA